MTRRLGLLLMALVIAVIGTSAVFAYVNRVEASATAAAQPVDVLVATQRIPSGTSATAAAQHKLVELTKMPKKSVPEGALTTLDALGTQTLVSDVFAGEILLRAKFADQTARTGALLIPKDKIAISVSLGDPQRVAGFLVPGSEVAIFATIKQVSATAQATAHTSAGSARVNVSAQGDDQYTRLLLPRVPVIAVGPATLKVEDTSTSGKDAVAKTVLTVAVDEGQAERLVHTAQTGDLWFGLLSPTSQTGTGEGVNNANLFR